MMYTGLQINKAYDLVVRPMKSVIASPPLSIAASTYVTMSGYNKLLLNEFINFNVCMHHSQIKMQIPAAYIKTQFNNANKEPERCL